MRKTLIYILLIQVLIFSACESQNEIIVIEQEEQIDSYLEENFPENTIIVNNGSRRIIIEEEEEETKSDIITLEDGDTVKMFYAGYVFDNGPSGLFTTNIESLAITSGLELTEPNFEILEVKYDKDTFIQGLYDGLKGVEKDEHSLIVFSSKYGFYDKELTSVPKMSALIYEVFIVDIIKN